MYWLFLNYCKLTLSNSHIKVANNIIPSDISEYVSNCCYSDWENRSRCKICGYINWKMGVIPYGRWCPSDLSADTIHHQCTLYITRAVTDFWRCLIYIICEVIKQNESEVGSDMLLVSEVLLHYFKYDNVNAKTSHLLQGHNCCYIGLDLINGSVKFYFVGGSQVSGFKFYWHMSEV